MKVIEYVDLDTSKVKRQYAKVKGFLANDDFHSAEVKKLAEHELYRAKRDDTNRLLFKLMTFGGEQYALILEVVHQHAYEKSKFLRGVPVDEAKVPAMERAPSASESLPVLRYVNPEVPRFHFLDKVIFFDPGQQEISGLSERGPSFRPEHASAFLPGPRRAGL